jgi:cell division protein FtsL
LNIFYEKEKTMNTKKFLIAALVLVVALVISAFAIVSFNGSQRALTGNLTSLNADQVSAYRRDARDRFNAGYQKSATADDWSFRRDARDRSNVTYQTSATAYGWSVRRDARDRFNGGY